MAWPIAGADAGNRDERLGEAVEAYLELAESGNAPVPEVFARSYPDLADELLEALDGLALVQGLVGSGSGPGGFGNRRLEAGFRVAGYRIVRELGRGGMGVVYEAVHVDLDRPVALKILGGHAAPGSSGRRRFLNEAKTAAALHHTHIVPVFDVGQVGGLCYYAMQRIEGCGLDRVIRLLRRDRLSASGSASGAKTPPSTRLLGDESASGWRSASGLSGRETMPDWSEVVRTRGRAEDRPPLFEPPTGAEYYRWVARVGQQAAEALAYAHRRGVIHRDVKPSNLLVDARGMVWVADFGLARRLEDPGQTRGDVLLGTPRYMSPEQAEGRSVAGATDIYSLGATLYELLTLRPPFDGQSTAELVRQIADREPIPPRRFARRLPRDLETIVLKAMSKRPEDRYASASELAEDLGRFLAVEPVRARRITPMGRAWRLARRHPVTTLISMTAAAVMLATAAVAYDRVADERDRAIRSELALAEALEKEQAARAEVLLNQLPRLRASTMPRRREEGRAMLREAAELAPGESMRLLLRDEALELLSARDVEDRSPLPTGRLRGIVPIGGGRDGSADRVAVLSEDGQVLTLWDVDGQRSPVAHQLLPPIRPGESGADSEEPERRGDGFPSFWPSLAAAGSMIAVVHPDGPGILLVDPESGSTTPLALEGAEVLGVLAPGRGSRLVTIEAIPREEDAEDDPARTRGRGWLSNGLRVRLWAIEGMPTPLATLDEIRVEPGSRRPSLPLVATDPEGRTVVLGWTDSTQVAFHNVEDGRRLFEFDTGIGLSALAAGPDGLIATAGDGRVLLWEVDPQAGGRAVMLPGLSEPRGSIRLLRFSPSGRLLASAGWNTGVELWAPSANTSVALVPTSAWGPEVEFADGRTLLVASGPEVARWSIVEPVGRIRFEFPADSPTLVPAFGPDGLLVMPLFDDAPRVWHPDQCPTRARPWEHPAARSSAIAFDPAGRLLAFGPDGLARFGRADGSPPLHRLAWPEPAASEQSLRAIRLLARSPDNHAMLLLRDFDARIDRVPDGSGGFTRVDPDELWLWRADESGSDGPGRLERLELAEPGSPRGAYLPATVLSAGGRQLFFLKDSRLGGWALDPDRPPEPLDLPTIDNARCLGISPDSRFLAIGGDDGEVRLISTESFRVVGRIPALGLDRSHRTTAVAFSPDGESLAVADTGGTLGLWDLSDPTQPRRLARLPGRRNPILALCFSPDGLRLASVDIRPSEQRVVEVWNLAELDAELEALGLGW